MTQSRLSTGDWSQGDCVSVKMKSGLYDVEEFLSEKKKHQGRN